MKSEFHDLAELELNSDGQSWGNLGYWKNASEYSKACRDLALLVGNAAKLDANSNILDAGFGCGDQILLWLQHFAVDTVCGINFSKSQTGLAKQNLRNAGLKNTAEAIGFGDACDERDWDQTVQSFSINRIIALDCAYHFSDRKKFLELAQSSLEGDGRIVLTDFLLADGFENANLSKFVVAAMLSMSRIPEANMINKQRYISRLESIGFRNVEVEDISRHVMTGFLAWLREHKAQSSANLASLRWTKYNITARFLDWAYRKNLLRYCVISAVKPN